MIIDDAFIQKWHPVYDKTEKDEPEYQCLIKATSADIIYSGTIGMNTLKDIYKWKSPRLSKIVTPDNYPLYSERIQRTVQLQEEAERLSVISQPGLRIGVVLGSTILHFIYPDAFPIMDVRTIGALKEGKYLGSKTPSIPLYVLFREIILSIRRDNPSWTLRQIDRALFAYHKTGLRLKTTC